MAGDRQQISFDIPQFASEQFQSWTSKVGDITDSFPISRVTGHDTDLIRVDLCVKRDPEVYQALLDVLVRLNRLIRTRFKFPPLLASGIRYHPEPFGSEVWQSVAALYLRGVGDCEDLSAALASEQNGGKAFLVPMGEKVTGGKQYHAITVSPLNGIEDPSLALGMVK